MLHELCMVGYACLHVMMAAVACAARAPVSGGMDYVSGEVRLGGEWPRSSPRVGGEARCWASPISGGSQGSLVSCENVRDRNTVRPYAVCGLRIIVPQGWSGCSCSRDRGGEPRSLTLLSLWAPLCPSDGVSHGAFLGC